MKNNPPFLFLLFYFILLCFLQFSGGIVFAIENRFPNIYVTKVDVSDDSYGAGNVVNGTFLLTNADEFIASDIFYEIKLVGNYVDGIPRSTYARSDLLGPISLDSKERKIVPFSYKLPRNISGNLGVEIQSKLENGMDLGRGNVTFSVLGSDNFLKIDRVYKTKSSSSTDLYNLAEGMILYEKNEKAFIHLELTNQTKKDQVIYPKIKVWNKTDSSKILLEEKRSSQLVKVGKSAEMEIELPVFNYTPGIYLGTLDLLDKSEEQVSPSLKFIYIVYGEIAEINRVTSNKEYGNKGETINIFVDISGAPFDFDLSRVATTTGYIQISLFNESDVLVGKYYSDEPLNFNDNTIGVYPIKLNYDSRSLKAKVLLLNKGGGILDQKETNLTKNVMPDDYNSQSTFDYKIIYYLFALFFLVATAFFISKKKYKISIFFFIFSLFIFGVIFLFRPGTTSAEWITKTYCYSENNPVGICGGSIFNIFVNVPNSTDLYAPGQSINLDSYVWTGTTAGHFIDASLAVSTPNGSSASRNFSYSENTKFDWSSDFQVGDGDNGHYDLVVSNFNLNTAIGNNNKLYATGTNAYNDAAYNLYRGKDSPSGDAGGYDGVRAGYVSYRTGYTYSLRASILGTGNGVITGNGINCGSDCTESFENNTSVTLKADPVLGSIFSGWSGGGCSGINTTCTVVMNSAKTVTANFNIVLTPTVTLTASSSTVNYGGTSILTWTSQNTTSCSAAWTTSTSTSGSEILSHIILAKNYIISCLGYNGETVSATTSVGFSCPEGGYWVASTTDVYVGMEIVSQACTEPAQIRVMEYCGYLEEDGTNLCGDDGTSYCCEPGGIERQTTIYGCHYGTSECIALLMSEREVVIDNPNYKLCPIDLVNIYEKQDLGYCQKKYVFLDTDMGGRSIDYCGGKNSILLMAEIYINSDSGIDYYVPDEELNNCKIEVKFIDQPSESYSIPVTKNNFNYIVPVPSWGKTTYTLSCDDVTETSSVEFKYKTPESSVKNLKIDSVTCDSVGLSWDSVGCAEYYVPIRRDFGEIGVSYDLSYTDNFKIKGNTEYSYQVDACNSDVCTHSSTVSTTTPLCAVTPPTTSLIATSTCYTTQGALPTNKVYVNKQMTWNIAGGSITIPSTATTTWSGTNIIGTISNTGTTYNKIYTTVGLKNINIVSSWKEGNTNYTASCSTTTDVIFGEDVIREI